MQEGHLLFDLRCVDHNLRAAHASWLLAGGADIIASSLLVP
jgi:hypothetical protein